MTPHAGERIDQWRADRQRAGAMLVALDFDGTLSAIVREPDDARVLPEAQNALAALAARSDTTVAVISGRAIEDVRQRVGIEGLCYGGNHGLELEGPGIDKGRLPHLRPFRPALERALTELREEVSAIPGVILEDKGLTVSVHFRKVPDESAQEAVRTAVHSLAARYPELRSTDGKKIVNLLPDLDWDKGHATAHILDVLSANASGALPALFIGDDSTDEDAFRALRGRGDGILVCANPPRTTAATAFLRSPNEVAAFLADLARP